MTLRLRQLYDRIKTSLWFVPGIMAVGAMILAVLMVSVDERLTADQIQQLHFIFKASPDGARSVLSTIAGALVTVAGVVFSITVVALTLASQQFGPRLLRNFMSDRTNQMTIGVFVGTFLYCLIVLGTVRGQDRYSFVPNVGVTGALLFTIVSLGVLVIYIHHTAASINASRLVEVVWIQLRDSIEHLFPERLGEGGEDQPIAPELDEGSETADAPRSGYVQAIDTDRIMKIASDHDLVIEFQVRPGDFIVRGRPVARLSKRDDEAGKRVSDATTIGSHRTPLEDPRFLIDQLVEVALRALSPGINDPFTAFSCIDYLGAALALLAERHVPSPQRKDKSGKVRVTVWGEDFETAMDAAFTQIRGAAAGMPAVLERLLQALDSIAVSAEKPHQRTVLSRHARQLARCIDRAGDEDDRRRLELALERLSRRLA